MVFAMQLEMILKLQNTLAQDCYLDLWRTGIGLVDSESCNYLLFGISRQCHARKDTPRLNLILFSLIRIAQPRGTAQAGGKIVGRAILPAAGFLAGSPRTRFWMRYYNT